MLPPAEHHPSACVMEDRAAACRQRTMREGMIVAAPDPGTGDVARPVREALQGWSRAFQLSFRHFLSAFLFRRLYILSIRHSDFCPIMHSDFHSDFHSIRAFGFFQSGV